VCSTLNAEVEAFIKLNTPGPQLCSVILYIGAIMGSVIQWGGFDSARVLTLPYFT
jgi:hypothetical protein